MATVGWYGVIGGILDLASSGITVAIIMGFFSALVFNPKG